MSFVMSPTTVEEAVGLLTQYPGALPLSGGASLVAMKNARLIDASHFISLADIPSLRGIEPMADGVRIGGMARHRDIAACDALVGDHAMLRSAAGQIANRVIRNMGTIGGAIGNADPAADYLPALACADAEVDITGPTGTRRVAMSDFVLDWYETVLEPGEIVTSVFLPTARDAPSVYRKLARTPGDYATASVACVLDGDTVRVAVGACGPKPIRDRSLEAALAGNLHDDNMVAGFGAALAAQADPVDDVRGSSEFRLRLIPRMVAAAVRDVRGSA